MNPHLVRSQEINSLIDSMPPRKDTTISMANSVDSIRKECKAMLFEAFSPVRVNSVDFNVWNDRDVVFFNSASDFSEHTWFRDRRALQPCDCPAIFLYSELDKLVELSYQRGHFPIIVFRLVFFSHMKNVQYWISSHEKVHVNRNYFNLHLGRNAFRKIFPSPKRIRTTKELSDLG